MSGVHAWRIVNGQLAAGGYARGRRTRGLRLANARDFRHGAAVNQVQPESRVGIDRKALVVKV
jgi:hypothetical protein